MMITDIANYLQSQGVGTPAVDLFEGLMPDNPNDCIALYEYGLGSPALHWNGEEPGLNVRIRNTSYGNGRTKAEQVLSTLHGLCETTLGTTHYLLIKANHSPAHLGVDKNDNHLFSINFTITKERGA